MVVIILYLKEVKIGSHFICLYSISFFFIAFLKCRNIQLISIYWCSGREFKANKKLCSGKIHGFCELQMSWYFCWPNGEFVHLNKGHRDCNWIFRNKDSCRVYQINKILYQLSSKTSIMSFNSYSMYMTLLITLKLISLFMEFKKVLSEDCEYSFQDKC